MLELDPLVAFEHGGEPLAEEHGGPVRVVVPGRYFYKSVKWLESVELLAEDRLGYWEAEAGYHNEADPFEEQRYVARNLDRRQVKRLLEQRDISDQDLLGVAARHLDLAGLQAREARLRNADLRGAILEGACFDGANLSNAHLDQARCSGATFRGADVEGASFVGADLRGTDFTGASLFGATFCAEPGEAQVVPAIVDRSTQIALDQLEPLSDAQQAFLRAHLHNGGSAIE